VLATGRSRVALLGLAFKTGTDDLRESPFVSLARILLGEGVQLSIHDTAMLSHVHGANRAYLERTLPHLNRLLRESVEAAVAEAEVIVVGHAAPAYERDAEWRAAGKIVLRLS
jgi:GDP-mannose 6-dehydrogenase